MKPVSSRSFGLAGISALLLAPVLSSCMDSVTDIQDKETRLLMIADGGIYSNRDTVNVLPPQTQYYKFDKRNYSGVSSISFLVQMATGSPDNPAIAKLYNITDNQVIEGSRLTTTSTDLVWVESGDIMDQLPNKPITLGILFSNADNSSIWSGMSSEFPASLYEATLVLKRN